METGGGRVDLRALDDSKAAADSDIPGAVLLLELVEATVGIEPGAGHSTGDAAADPDRRLAWARDAVRARLGSAALVDAAAVIGNFERMVRIADATGIPLDTPVRVAGEALRGSLDLERFAHDGRWPEVPGWQRALGRLLQPILRQLLRWRGRRPRGTPAAAKPEV